MPPTPVPGVETEDLVALFAYLNHDHAKIDRALRALDMPALKELNAHIRLTTYTLSRLPDQRGTVWLGADLRGEPLAHYAPGTVVREHGFICASADARLRPGGNVTYAVRSVNARLVHSLAERPEELTVMFFTGTRFKVLGVERDDVGAAATVYLSELPDRRLLKSPSPAEPGGDAALLAAMREAARARAALPAAAHLLPHDATLYLRAIGLADDGQPFPVPADAP